MRGYYPDRGTPHCPCGCAKEWADKYHMWICPHCDLEQAGPQQTVLHVIRNEDADELLRMQEVCGTNGNLRVVRADGVARADLPQRHVPAFPRPTYDS